MEAGIHVPPVYECDGAQARASPTVVLQPPEASRGRATRVPVRIALVTASVHSM